MRVLVTGAAGFIGSHVVKTLIQQQEEVFAMVRPGGSLARLEDVQGELSLVEDDLLDTANTRSTVREVSPDLTIHLAWMVGPDPYLHARGQNLLSLQAGLGLVNHLIDAGCGRLVIAGTCLENVNPPPQMIYVTAKRALHRIIEAVGGEDFSCACAHIFYLYGPWEDKNRLTPLVIRALLAGQEARVTGGAQLRDYLHVSDVAAAICAVGASDICGAVDLCSGRPVLVRELFETIGRVTGRPDLIRTGARPYDEQDALSVVGDPSVVKQMGWRPTYSLEDGIRDTVAWWAEHSPSTHK